MPSPPEHHVCPKAARLAFVLDDEREVGALVCNILYTLGFTSHHFQHPMSFLVKAKTAKPDLVVLDLALGQSDAVDVIRQLEVLKYSGRVLLISGRDQATLDEINDIGIRRGLSMLPALRKPFRASEVKERLLAVPETMPETNGETATTQSDPNFTVSLEEALERNWLELWYQPKIDLKSLTVCGAEVLVRARHPLYGIVLPVSLLPPAGDPLYHPLTSAVIRRAMADWAELAANNVFLRLAVNVPASVYNAPNFVDFVRKLLPKHPKFPGLIVEITEDEVIRDPGHIREIATQLKLYNISTSIDDFGSAYASLSRFLELPCEELKLDRTFVSGCSSDQLKHALCQTVIDLSHRFGIKVCAEGIEQTQDLRALLEMGCDVAQGFLFAKPMPLDQLTRMLLAPMTHPSLDVPSPSQSQSPIAKIA
ncbi:MAG: EAL domain-containing response regulator [Pseudorhodoplanes sp.]|nr:EAL domain-containing response regulator [Pseudorhodoplanes sp.]